MVTENWNVSLERNYEVTRKDLVKDKALKHGAWLTPLLISVIPALIIFIIGFTSTSAALIFTSLIWLVGAFIFGLIISGIMLYYRQRWLARVREQIAVDGIKTDEVRWFTHELSTAERKALKEIDSQNRMLGDAYRETLASRLTATRIVKTTKKELLLVQKRQNKLKYLKSGASDDLQKQLTDDRGKLEGINTEAKQMQVEAETRLQMIEAASRRGGNVADSELALKKLSARAEQLPLALESLKMEEDIRRELEESEKDLNLSEKEAEAAEMK